MSRSDAMQSILSLPTGGGALRSMGEKFAPAPYTGTGNVSVPLALPDGRNGFQPSLDLAYSTGHGNGPFGLGWLLGIPGVVRKTSHRIPRYQDDANDIREQDTFILSGAEDLVSVGAMLDERGRIAERYRPRTEELFTEILRYRDAGSGTDYWRVRSKNGFVSYYGTNPAAGEHPRYSSPGTSGADPATIATPDNPRRLFEWKLTLTKDPFGNRIEYLYETDAGQEGGHRWRQPRLALIRYADFGDPDDPAFAVQVTFTHEARPDPVSSYRAGFEIRTSTRCHSILVETIADRRRLVRRYEFSYAQAPQTTTSQLRAIDIVSFDDAGVGTRDLPPLEFAYTAFEPGDPRRRSLLHVTGADLPPTSLANKALELVDLFGRGLPDIVELSDTARFWRNRGNGVFDLPRPMREAPSGVALSDGDVKFVDANGDGRVDLLVTRGDAAGYYPMQSEGLWDRRSFCRYAYAPSFDVRDPEVHLVDLDGDGTTDAVRSGTRFECFFSDARDGWRTDNTRWTERQTLETFPNVNFSDPRVKWGDLSGDGLQDIVVIADGNVEYWPNLGYGRWGARLHMRNSPRLKADMDPRRILLGDVNGDGLADIVYVDDRKVSLWINQSGNGWSDAVEITGTPPVSDMDAVRLVDLLGSGISGVLWSRDARGPRQEGYWFLDVTGGTKPHLLHEMRNNMGAVTRVGYRPSTAFYLDDDRDPRTRWRTPLPFPVQVVACVEVIDELSRGKLTTEYRYHHGYWDGVEREFRGFGMVEQLDTEGFEIYHRAGRHGADATFGAIKREHFSAPTLTKTWFHQGAVEDTSRPGVVGWRELDWQHEYWAGDRQLLEHGRRMSATLTSIDRTHTELSTQERRSIQRDALRALRGSVLRTELYALDSTSRERTPFTVTERAYELREESAPPPSSSRRHIFFSHVVAERTTQWERGDDPHTTFGYTRDFDAFGNPLTQIQIACPRGWRAISDPVIGASYLATVTSTVMATPQGNAYIHDCVAKTVISEIVNQPIAPGPGAVGRTLQQILSFSAANLSVVGETVNFYDADSTVAGGLAFEGLPFGVVGEFGALTRSEELTLNERVLTAAYGAARPPYLTPGQVLIANPDYPLGFVQGLAPDAGYVFHAAGGGAGYSGGYYVTTERNGYDFHRAGVARGLVLEQRDPLGAATLIAYDEPYALRPRAITSAVGLQTRADYNYRVLQPELLIDPNGNRTRVDYSPTGLASAVWVLGKESRGEGDVAAPSATFEYDFRAFLESTRVDPTAAEPVSVTTRRRTRHDSDPDDAGEAIESREYSDGFGRVLQTRTQAEDAVFGDPTFGGGDTILPARQSDGAGGDVRSTLVSDRVVVSGTQRYDNKGRVIEKREPYFSQGWDYAVGGAAANAGASVTMFYDPRGQVIRTRNEDGSEQRIIYGIPIDIDDPTSLSRIMPTPWEAYTYDANDNAGRTHPQASSGYRHHWNTPSSVTFDALGRIVRTVARTRGQAAGAGAVPSIEAYETRSTYDIQGNLLVLTDRLNRDAFQHVYDLAQRAIRTTSVDAGERTVVFDAAGQEIERSDGKQARILFGYDVINRPLRRWARNGPGSEMSLREEAEYGDAGRPDQPAADRELARESNRLAKLTRQRDEAGEVRYLDYDFKGNLREKTRAVIADRSIVAAMDAGAGPVRQFVVNWDEPPALDGSYQISTAYDGLNRITSMRLPRDVHGARKRLTASYNRAGALSRVVLDGDVFVEHIAYSARGQRILTVYGNGTMTRHAYDRQTARLVRLRTDRCTTIDALTYRRQGNPLQDFGYVNDLVGNVIRITDLTPGCGVRNNAEAARFTDLAVPLAAGDALVRTFEYDPLYRLLSATGREASSIPETGRPWEDLAREGFDWGGPGTPAPDTARDRTRTYRETYAYDAANNMVTMGHGTWTRRFGMSGHTPDAWAHAWRPHLDPAAPWPANSNNRLTHVGDDDPTAPQTHFFDENGNLIRENAERHFAWDAADRLIAFATRAGAGPASVEACYLYDSAGGRVKRVVRRGTAIDTTVYVDRIFEHHVAGGAANNHLHVMDDQKRLAVVRVGDPLPDDGGPAVQYSLGDHLGTANVVLGGIDASASSFVNREEFFPFGETSFGSFGHKRYRFAGNERLDESGLYYSQARFCAPHLARWVSCDPAGSIDSLMLYEFCRSNPITYTDTSGLQAEPHLEASPEQDPADVAAASRAAAAEVKQQTETHKAEAKTKKGSSRAGTQANTPDGTKAEFTDKDVARMSKGENVVNKRGVKPTNCTEVILEANRAYFKRMGQEELSEQIEQIARDTRGPSTPGGKELESARLTALIQQLKTEAGWETAYIQLEADAPAGQTVKDVRKTGVYPAVANTVKGADSQQKRDVRTEVDATYTTVPAPKPGTPAVVARLEKIVESAAADALLARLEKATYAIGTVDAGRHGFIVADGKAYQVHWNDSRKNPNLYEISDIRTFLSGYKDAVVAFPR
jgi:RHS repeat-associated protein